MTTVTKRSHITFLPSFVPQHSDASKNIFMGLNGITLFNDSDGSSKIFYAYAAQADISDA